MSSSINELSAGQEKGDLCVLGGGITFGSIQLEIFA